MNFINPDPGPFSLFFEIMVLVELKEVFISLDHIESQVPMQLFEAERAESQGPSVAFFKGITPVHGAGILLAVVNSEYMSGLVNQHPADPFLRLLPADRFTGLAPELREIPDYAVNPYPVLEASLSEDIVP